MTLEAVTDRAFAPVREAVAAGRIPGAALAVADAAGGRAVRWAGQAALLPQPAPLDRATWFDLASLTKVIVTTPEILRLVETGAVDLDDPLSRHLPDLSQYDSAAPVRRLTVRQCLAHQTGLPAVEPLYTWGGDAETVKALVLQRVWRFGEAVYSDINFILLGLLIERQHGIRFRDLTVPEGLDFAPDPARCAATEQCTWRGRVLRGEVHDENAWALGGAAGHAGLFGTIDGVAGFAAAMLAGRGLSPAALEEMRRPQAGTRALGWERRNPGWTGGSLCAPETLGHTGFTGVGLWLDFARGVGWALLTNRVHPSRHRETGIMDLRRTVGNIVAGGWTW